MFFFCSFQASRGVFMQDDVVAEPIRLIFHNDDKTPVDFVVSLLRTVFGKSERDAHLVITEVMEQGQCGCGPYPASVGKALFEEAELRIREAGHPLRLTCESAANDDEEDVEEDEDVPFTHAYEALAWHFADTP